jgi:hypothetical protein
MEDRQAVERKLIAIRENLKKHIRCQGEVIYSLDVSDGSLAFRATRLKFERVPDDQNLGQFNYVWWVSGTWEFDGEIQDIPLPIYFGLCLPDSYPRIASNFMRGLWSDGNVPSDAMYHFVFLLICIAQPRSEYNPPSQLLVLGIWPSFEGEWNSIQRFAAMLYEYQKVRYFGYSYETFPALRTTIIETLKTMPLPEERFAKYFIEACADFWRELYFRPDSDGLEAIKQLILKVSIAFEVYPCGNFEPLAVEKYINLFRQDRIAFLAYVVKEANQMLAGMPNLELTTEVPFEHERNRIPRIVHNERYKIENAIKKCEIELEYVRTNISNPEATYHRSNGTQELQNLDAANSGDSQRTGDKKSARTRNHICTKFENDYDFREWVESLFSEDIFHKNSNDQIPWGLLYSAFARPNGTSYTSSDSASGSEQRIPTNFAVQRDLLRWMYQQYQDGTLIKKSKTKSSNKSDMVQWATWCRLLVQPNSSSYIPKQLSTQWTEICAQEKDIKKPAKR